MSTSAESLSDWPHVSVVIPTHHRPTQVRAAISSVLEQDYPGTIDIIVVHDQETPDHSLPASFSAAIHSMSNDRTPGLCGARNSGILHARGELVAFCDDDDLWLPGKLAKQVALLEECPSAVMSSTAMVVRYEDTTSVRLAGRTTLTYADLISSRWAMLPSASFVFRRSWLTGADGFLNEEVPGSLGEDWDLLLRAARTADIAHIDEPLVEVLWGGTGSFFVRDWTMKVAANEWFLNAYPDIRQDARGAARIYGQNGFYSAVSGNKSTAIRWAVRALRERIVEPRAWLTLPVLLHRNSAAIIMRRLHTSGKGI